MYCTLCASNSIVAISEQCYYESSTTSTRCSCSIVVSTVHISLEEQLLLFCAFQSLLNTHWCSCSCVVFSEVLSRVLGLEGDECDPVECKMVVTVFQFAAFFLQFDE